MDGYGCIPINPRVHRDLVTCAARHNTSVEVLVSEAIRTYLLDVEAGLMIGPEPVPRYLVRPRRWGGPAWRER